MTNKTEEANSMYDMISKLYYITLQMTNHDKSVDQWLYHCKEILGDNWFVDQFYSSEPFFQEKLKNDVQTLQDQIKERSIANKFHIKNTAKEIRNDAKRTQDSNGEAR